MSSGNLGGDAARSTAARSGGEVQSRLHAERTGRPFLVLRDGAGVQRIVELDAGARPAVTIGRSDSADVALSWDCLLYTSDAADE